MTKRIREEFGYSLVEVLASIVILTIAIIPMATMFDAGLRTAVLGSNYDKARTLANERLEISKTLSYSMVDGNDYPGGTPTDCGPGCRRYIVSPVPASFGLPQGSTYEVEKQYVILNSTTTLATLADKSTNSGMMRLKVTVKWPGNNSVTVSGISTRGLS